MELRHFYDFILIYVTIFINNDNASTAAANCVLDNELPVICIFYIIKLENIKLFKKILKYL